MRSLILILTLCIPLAPAFAGEDQSITEEHLRALSDAEYIALITDPNQAGWDYTPEQVASGLKRHYQERRARMIDVGFTVVSSNCS
jgi:hypothetical protein